MLRYGHSAFCVIVCSIFELERPKQQEITCLSRVFSSDGVHFRNIVNLTAIQIHLFSD